MKKFAALLAFAAVLFTACNNKKGDDVVPLPKAPNQENHVYLKINPDDNIQIPLPDPDDPTTKINDKLLALSVSSSNYGMTETENIGHSAFEVEVMSDTRAPKEGTSYKFLRLGTFTITHVDPEGWVNVKFVPEDNPSAEVIITGDIVVEPFDGNELCRAWKVDKTNLTVDGGGLGGGKIFNGCNINEISKWLREKEFDVDEQPSSYNVTTLLLLEDGNFAILFEGEKPYYGPFQLGKEGSFSYKFDADAYDENDPVIAGEASGSFTLVSSGKGRLELNADFKDNNDKSYKVNVIFELLPA
ncbi:MAG: hypothetical protein IKP46_07710 [Bacteroidales bacterium]|nr:hypothetical protein [Bacteroidales bacterium]